MIIKFFKHYGNVNALILTPAPTETAPQFTKDMFYKYHEFNDLNIIHLTDKTIKKLNFTDNNVIVASKQFLEKKTINEIKNLKLDIIVFDENHNGGTTNLSEQIINSYSCKKTTKLYLTATFQKSLNKWIIPEQCQMYWNIEDEQMCKQQNINFLIDKHGQDVLKFVDDEKLQIYNNMPNLYVLTTMMDSKRYEVIKEKIMDSKYGFSMEVLFSINKNGTKFNYPNEVEKVLRYISGSNKEEDYKFGDKSIFGRIKNISLENNSRTVLDNENFTSQLWFLPFGIGLKIDKVSECLKKKMLNDKILKDFEIMIINSKVKYKIKDLKGEINKKEIEVLKKGKRGLILLAGNQCSLGITLPLVDIVMLLNNTLSSDKIFQMMYRCMSETLAGDKKFGYVVDLNISRVLNTVIDYNVHQKDMNIENKIKYIIDNNLINIDNDLFNNKQNKTDIVNKLLNIWKSDPINNLKTLLRKIENNVIDIESKDQIILNKYLLQVQIIKQLTYV